MATMRQQMQKETGCLCGNDECAECSGVCECCGATCSKFERGYHACKRCNLYDGRANDVYCSSHGVEFERRAS